MVKNSNEKSCINLNYTEIACLFPGLSADRIRCYCKEVVFANTIIDKNIANCNVNMAYTSVYGEYL